MKSSEESAQKKMSFAPGWARSSSVGLVRTTSLSSTGGQKPAAKPQPESVSNLASLGRVPSSSGRSGGKLTEQANLYHQQTKSPTSKMKGAPRIRYSRDELLLYQPRPMQPSFPAHVSPAMICHTSQEPAVNQLFDRETLFREWQIESEKRNASRPSVPGSNGPLTGDRRGTRGRRSDNMMDPSDPGQRPGRGFNTTSNWRSSGKDGRFDSVMRPKQPDPRWPSTGGGARWNNLPAGDRRDSRSSEGGPSRWDKLGRSNGPPFGRGGSTAVSSGDPTRDNELNRWRRPSNAPMGGFDALEEDDRGTFSEAALEPGGLGLDSMAEAAEKFHLEMEEARKRVQDGLDLNDDSSQTDSLRLLGMVKNDADTFGHDEDDILNAPLEEGLDHPPEEEIVPADEAIDAANGSESLSQAGSQMQNSSEQGGWGMNPWVSSTAAAPPQEQRPPAQSHGWVVPPPATGGLQRSAPPVQQQLQPPPNVLPSQMAGRMPLQPPPVPPPMAHIPDEWFYQDPQGNVQGPFKSEEMREWLEHGYFNSDLLIRSGTNEPFTPLGQRFPDIRKAFSPEAERERQMMMMHLLMQQQQQQQPQEIPQQQPQQPFFWSGVNPVNPVMQQQLFEQRRQQQEEERKREEQARLRAEENAKRLREEEERKLQHERMLLMEQQRKAKEEEEKRRLEGEAQRRAEAERQREFEEEQKRQALAAEERRRKALLEEERRQLEEARAKEEEEEEALARAEAERRKAEEKPAWGGAAIAPPVSTKLSLKEIQEMEEREAQKHRPASSSGSLSMAARIAQAAGVVSPVAAQSVLASQQVQQQQTSVSSPVASAPAQESPSNTVEEEETPVNAYGSTLNEMSIDLRAMLGVGNAQKKQSNKHPEKPAWGSTPKPSTVSSKSLKEIQEEEAKRLRAAQQQQAAQTPQRAGSWAADAPTPAMAAQMESKGWSGPKSRGSVADIVAQNIPPEQQRKLQQQAFIQQQQQQRQRQTGSTPSSGTPASNKSNAHRDEFGAPVSSDSAAQTNFGGKQMSAEMRKWCESQTQPLGATMTLIEFCYTLEDASDIREYLRDYLGSTPQVSAFASEFIQRKMGKKGTSDDGADAAGFVPAPSKKNKKKKKGAAAQ